MAAPIGNKFALGLRTNGRNPIFEDTESLISKITAYFDTQKELKKKKYTTTGLSLFLGFESRQSLYDYRNRNEEYSYIIKRALSVIENGYEEKLFDVSATGAIFALKNMGWKDSFENNLLNNGKSFDPPKIIETGGDKS